LDDVLGCVLAQVCLFAQFKQASLGIPRDKESVLGDVALEPIGPATSSLIQKYEIAIAAHASEHLQRIFGVGRRSLAGSSLKNEQRFS